MAKLRLYLGRSVFPLLFDHLCKYKEKENKINDEKFLEQVKWLRKLQPAELDPQLVRVIFF